MFIEMNSDSKKRDVIKCIHIHEVPNSKCKVADYERVIYDADGNEIWHAQQQQIVHSEFNEEFFYVPNSFQADSLPYYYNSLTDNMSYNLADAISTVKSGGGDQIIYTNKSHKYLVRYYINREYVCMNARKWHFWEKYENTLITYDISHIDYPIFYAKCVAKHRDDNCITDIVSTDRLPLCILECVSHFLKLDLCSGDFSVDDIAINYDTMSPIIKFRFNIDGESQVRMIEVSDLIIDMNLKCLNEIPSIEYNHFEMPY